MYSCASSKQNTEIEVEAVKDPIAVISIELVDAIRSGNTKALRPYYPSINATRLIMGAKGMSYTDDQVQSQVLDPLKDRLEGNLTKLNETIKSLNIDPKTLTYNSHLVEYSDNLYKKGSVVTVKIDNSGKLVEIPITVLKFNEEWYILEIIKTTNLF